jgi:predicted Rossmann fold flavoprotein
MVTAALAPGQAERAVILSEAGASPRSRRTPMISSPPMPSEPLTPDSPSSTRRGSQRPTRTRPPAFREKLLITHRGLSGPAILQISSYWDGAQPIALDLAPDRQIFAPLTASEARRDPASALTALKTVLPTRWAERWLTHHLPPEAPRQLGNALLQQLERHLHAWTLTPAGTEGYEKAEVTAGGVDTAELEARSLQSRKVPGLYFIGEVVDVTGWLGGYNFQWAWASGAAAGRSA